LITAGVGLMGLDANSHDSALNEFDTFETP